ncbi:6228_t:CDS:2, partial [Diversispora eburnea]
LKEYHTQAILEAKERSQFDRKQVSELGNEILNNYCDSNIQDDFTKSCLSFIDSQELLLSEQVRSTIRLDYLPKVPNLAALSEQNQSKKHGISPSVHIMIIYDGYNSIIPRMMRRVSKLKRHGEWNHGLGQKKQPLFVIQDGKNNIKETFIE